MAMKVLICDDSSFFRRVMIKALSTFPDVEIVGSAPNGKLALQRIRELQPDLLTLDMEMPEMDGLSVLDALRQSGEKVTVIVVSALTRQGGKLTMKALEKGAFDFITKPDTVGAEDSLEALRTALAPRISVLARRLEVKRILNNQQTSVPTATRPSVPTRQQDVSAPTVTDRVKQLLTPDKPNMILIGVSTGGPNALARVFSQLPDTLDLPIFIVQHMPPVFTASLAENLTSKSPLRVKEAAHSEIAVPNTAYIAPGGKQMRIVPASSSGIMIQVTSDPPENNCRPSVDYLFRSAAQNFPGRSVAVVMTGMGNDGSLGLVSLKQRGCFVIAQDEATSVVFGMPKAAIDMGVVDVVLPLESIAAQIIACARPRKR